MVELYLHSPVGWCLINYAKGKLYLTVLIILYPLLALASAIFLWSESLGTRDHILLSQIMSDRAEQSRAEQSRAEAYCRQSAGTVTPGIAPRWDLWPYIYYLYDNYVFFSCGAPSLTRGRVSLLYMLLALASAIFLWSEPLGPRDHILLSHIWDFPFCRLLRLAGSRWRYSIPPPHGEVSDNWRCFP
jgi:hypothetical protein